MTTTPDSEVLDEEFLAQQRAQLQAERGTLSEVVEMFAAEIRNHLRRRESGQAVSEGLGTGETASVELEQARGQRDHALAQLEEVDAALARLAAGTYGRCGRCGGPIARNRLEAIPTAARCIACQSLPRYPRGR